MTNKEFHECKFYKGKIKDVTVNNKNMFCRRCGGFLLDSQVDSEMLKRINRENRKKIKWKPQNNTK